LFIIIIALIYYSDDLDSLFESYHCLHATYNVIKLVLPWFQTLTVIAESRRSRVTRTKWFPGHR